MKQSSVCCLQQTLALSNAFTVGVQNSAYTQSWPLKFQSLHLSCGSLPAPLPQKDVSGLLVAREQCLEHPGCCPTSHMWHWSPAVWLLGRMLVRVRGMMVRVRGTHLGGDDGDLTNSLIKANSSSAAAPTDLHTTESCVHKTTYPDSASQGLNRTKPPLKQFFIQSTEANSAAVSFSCLHQLPSQRKLPSYNQDIFQVTLTTE